MNADALTTTALPKTPAGPARLRWLAADAWVLARRQFAHIRQIPEKLFDVTLQPLMFVLLFSYVFGGVIHVPGGDYHEYLIGGILVQTLVFGLMGPGVSMATDLGEGIIDRFSSLPMSRPAYLIGHLTAEFCATLLAIAIMIVAGLIVGWGISSTAPEAVAGFGLLFLLAIAMIWLGTLIGILARSPDGVQGIAFITVFPLTFVANTFVPVGGLPEGLRQVAEYNPVSAWAAAVRTLFGNPTAVPSDAAWPLEHPVVAGVLWCVAILAVVIPLTVRAYRRRTTG
ncbi:MAG TPA: ABC transporter permease [Solirubrobacterales bacterium]|nr:ABC transporter permease [Solirubrobacterales bacterium]